MDGGCTRAEKLEQKKRCDERKEKDALTKEQSPEPVRDRDPILQGELRHLAIFFLALRAVKWRNCVEFKCYISSPVLPHTLTR